MRDGFKDYDRWKLASPDDEQEEQESQCRRDDDAAERSDVMRDREKDERRQEAEMERRMLHGDD